MGKTKTTCFNLIILDESGSMSPLAPQTIAGCNETLNVIRSLQEKYDDSQRQLVSIYVFQSGNPSLPSRYLCKNVPVQDVKDITDKDYRPSGCTPLLDAVGATLVDLKAVAATHEDAVASVTIITDGMENSSEEYSWQQVSNLISQLKELGWNFNFIGANIDVDMVSRRMNIDNAMAFRASSAGTKNMMDKFASNLASYHEDRIASECAMPPADRVAYRKERSKSFFHPDSTKKEDFDMNEPF
ncbi:MAG: VWA domain-containing protein [Muribaculaceae bacterium]|nr:VWA domain-containing protein [Muribaculaceae bacterium]MDE7109295.1 VWA domain-containing protein [Muribaculaceae bacterium]